MKHLPIQYRPSTIPISLRKFRALPTWLVNRLAIPMLKPEHPWYGKKFRLRDWYLGETELSRNFDFLLWVSWSGAAYAILHIWSK